MPGTSVTCTVCPQGQDPENPPEEMGTNGKEWSVLAVQRVSDPGLPFQQWCIRTPTRTAQGCSRDGDALVNLLSHPPLAGRSSSVGRWLWR